MIGFFVGCKQGYENPMPAFLKLLEELSGYDGFEQILMDPDDPYRALVCFETMEQAQTAQWMMDMNGVERRDGHGQTADAGESCGDPGLQGYGHSAEDHAGNDSHGESAESDGESAGRMDQ